MELYSNLLSQNLYKEAVDHFKAQIADDKENSLKQMNEFLFNSSSKLVPVNFVQSIKKEIDLPEFRKLSADMIRDSFWGAKNPNINSLINYWGLFNKIFYCEELRREKFVEIISKHIESFPSSAYKSLAKMVQSFLLSIKNEKIEKISNCTDYFGVYSPETIILTAFLSVSNKDIGYKSLIPMVVVMSTCIQNGFNDEKIQLFIKEETLKKFFVGNRYILLKAEISKMPKCSFLVDELIRECIDIFNDSFDTEDLIIVYSSFSQLINSNNFIQLVEPLSSFLIRDFDTSNDFLKFSLTGIFTKIMKIGRKEKKLNEIAELLMSKIQNLPINCSLFRWISPKIIPYCNKQQSQDFLLKILDMINDPLNQCFISKTIIYLDITNFIDVVIEKVKNYSSSCALIELQFIFSPFFKKNPQLVQNSISKILKINNDFIRSWLMLEISISVKNQIDINSLREYILYGQKSGNWDLRVLALTSYELNGFPYNESDINSLIDSMPSIILTNYKFSSISPILNKLIQNKNLEPTLPKLIAIFSDLMSPKYSIKQRQFGFDICALIWKQNPNLISKIYIINLISFLDETGYKSEKIVHDFLNQQSVTDIIKTFSSKFKDPDTLDIDIHKQLTIEELKRFHLFVERNSVSDLKIVQVLFEQLKQNKYKIWEYQKELFEIITIILKNNQNIDVIKEFAQFFFDFLLNTRIKGFIQSSFKSFEQVLKLIANTNLIQEFSIYLLKIFKDFDMSSMRRSAGLPFIILALIKSSPQNSVKFVSAIADLIENSSNSNETTNCLNILKSIIDDSEASDKMEQLLPRFFKLIFLSAGKFNDWDVLLAVDQAITAFLKKVCKINGNEETLNSISYQQFFAKIGESRDIILDSLKNGNQHQIYMSLQLLSMFQSTNEGDIELMDAIFEHHKSKSSRFRRAAARSYVVMTPFSQRYQICEKLLNQKYSSYNELHGKILILYEFNKAGLPKKLIIPIYNNLPKMIWKPYIYLLHFNGQDEEAKKYFEYSETMSEAEVTSLIQRWNYYQPSDKLLKRLQKDLLSSNLPSINRTYSFHGLEFLINYSQKLPEDYLTNVLSLIPKVDSIVLKSYLIELLTKFENINSTQIKTIFNELMNYCFDLREEMSPVQISISKCSDIIVKNGGWEILLLLSINDFPLVRTNVSYKLFGDNCKNDWEIIQYAIKHISQDKLVQIGNRWIDLIDEKVKTDEWGENISVFIDDFFISNICFPGLRESFEQKINTPMLLTEMRRLYLSTFKEYK